MTFLTEAIMTGTDWHTLERVVARLMTLAGWSNVSVIGGSGDKGADIIGVRDVDGRPKTWVVQVKAVIRGNYVGVSAINEVVHAMSLYNSKRGGCCDQWRLPPINEKKTINVKNTGI